MPSGNVTESGEVCFVKTRKQKHHAGAVATTVLKVRCDDAFKARVCGHAKERGETPAAWVRRALRQQLDIEATFRFRPPPQIDPNDLAQAPVLTTAEEDEA